MRVLLDTHALVWLATDDRSLGRRCRSLAEAALARGELCTSAISFWEIAMLAAQDRIEIADGPEELRQSLLANGVRELAVTGDIAISAATLALHGDPADRFIAASAIAHGAILATADERLLEWKHRLARRDARR